MAKPSPAQINPARYPFTCTIEPRFGDLDINMHINNVAMIDILEDARVRFHRASGFAKARSGELSMIVSFNIEYIAQGYYPAPLQIHVGLLTLGRTSYRLGHLVTQRDKAVAYGESVLVCMAGSSPAPVPKGYIDTAAQWMIRA